jgi:hypothetical protein
MDSGNARRCAQNADDGFANDFYIVERYHKDDDESINHIVSGDDPKERSQH